MPASTPTSSPPAARDHRVRARLLAADHLHLGAAQVEERDPRLTVGGCDLAPRDRDLRLDLPREALAALRHAERLAEQAQLACSGVDPLELAG